MFSPISPSESSLSIPSLSSAGIGSVRRKRFDDRAQTLVSLQLKAHMSLTQPIPSLMAQGDARSKVLNMVRWSEIKQVSKLINSPDFVAEFGNSLYVDLSPMYIAVGTDRGAVIGFNYHQEVVFVLVLHHQDGTSFQGDCAVTSMAFSADSTFFAAGYMDGKLAVWDLNAQNSTQGGYAVKSPYGTILPVSLENRFARNHQGHLAGVPVNSVQFVGDLQHHFVSSDVSGLVFFHHGFRKFLKKYYVSQKLLGQNDSNQTDSTKNFTIKDCQILPLGTSPQITDHIGLLAVMSSNILAIVSVRSLNNSSSVNPITHFKISKSKHVKVDNEPVSGCLSWYPCLQNSNGVKNAKLAYAWNNVLTILELDNNGISLNIMQVISELKDKDKAIPKLPIYKTARWQTHDPHDQILSLNWLNSEILTALVKSRKTTETKLYFFYYSSQDGKHLFVEVGVDDLDSQQITWNTLETKSRERDQSLKFYNYKNSLRIFRHTLMILVNSHSLSQKNILTGKVFKWADRLMDFLDHKNFLDALLKANEYYCSDNFGHLVLSGLPHTAKERHDIVRPFLIQIMTEAVVPIFTLEDEQSDPENTLTLYLHIITMLTKENGGLVSSELLEILESIYENFAQKEEFFRVLEHFIISKKIRNLSPTLFKHLVEYYAHTGEGDSLTEIICILDTQTLNIDQTLQLCDLHGLRECSVYIWNQLLHDYMTPYVRLIEDLELPRYDNEQKLLVYSYMSYVLTGRQFPSDEFMNATDAEQSRKDICGLLFSIGSITWPKSSTNILLPESLDAVFPYLFHFLKFNTFETLVTLNEFFEHPCLNSDIPGELNRQYIIDALLDNFQINESSFSETDCVHLSIFIARNYPKYFQFIRLLETVLQTTFERLCNNKDPDLHSDCELALESLLPFYNVENDNYLLEQIKAAKFYDVLFEIYRSEGKFANALEVWLQKQRDLELTIDHERSFAVLASIIEATFKPESGNSLEKNQLVRFIGDHFDELISRNTDDMVVLANSHNKDLHLLALKCKDHSVAYQYLSVLFSRYDYHDVGNSRIELVTRYLELLAEFSPEDILLTNLNRFVDTIVRNADQKQRLEAYFSENNYITALSVLLKQEGRFTEALDKLTTAIQHEVDAYEATSIAKTESYIGVALSVCDEAHEDEGLWKLLVEKLVKMTVDATPEMVAVLNQGIYQCFRSITNQNPTSNQDSFTSIFNDILEVATIANVRAILQEILTSYFFDSEMHKITVNKINQGIYKYMYQIKMDTLQGWLFKSQNCTSCGKPICGKNVLAAHMLAWENRERDRVFLTNRFDPKDYREAEIVLFKCSHGYHSQCLANLGGLDKCVICTSE